MMAVPELMALSSKELQAYIEALSDQERIDLREACLDWLIDEMKFTIVHGERRCEK